MANIDGDLGITLLYSPAPRVAREWVLSLKEGASVAQALAACPIFQEFPELLPVLQRGSLPLGIWGQKSSPSDLLRDQDRVEIYRPLRVDPKIARRERFHRQGAKSAGLFAKKRLGAKAGY